MSLLDALDPEAATRKRECELAEATIDGLFAWLEQRDRAAREADPDRCTLAPIDLRDLAPMAHVDDYRGEDTDLGSALDRMEADRRAAVIERVRAVLVGNGPRYRFRADGIDAVLAVLKPYPDSGKVGAKCFAGTPEELVVALTAAVNAHEERTHREEQEQTLTALLTSTAVSNIGAPTPIRWLVRDVVPAEGLLLVAGASGSRKTFTGMSLALAIASGCPWAAQPVVERGRVVLALFEGTLDDRRRRLHRLARGLGVTIEALGSAVLIYPHSIDPKDAHSMAQLATFLRDTDARMLLIDNLSELHDGSWSDPQALRATLLPLVRLARGDLGVPRLNVTLLAHTGVSGHVRGRDAVLGLADDEYVVEASSDRNDAIVTLRRGKFRNGGGVDVELRFRDRDAAIVPERVHAERESSVSMPRDHERREQILELLPLGSQELYAAMHEDHGCGRTVCKRVRDALESEGLIAQREGVWRRVGE